MFLMHFLFISGGEIFFIMFIVVMVFGSDKIPGIAKGLGKGMRQLDATNGAMLCGYCILLPTVNTDFDVA